MYIIYLQSSRLRNTHQAKAACSKAREKVLSLALEIWYISETQGVICTVNTDMYGKHN